MSTVLCADGLGCLGCSFCEALDEEQKGRKEEEALVNSEFTFGDFVNSPEKNDLHPNRKKH